MNTKLIFFISLLIFTISMVGCGGSATNTNVIVGNATNSNGNTNSMVSTTKKPDAETVNNAPTIAPVVAAYYEALKKKDAAGIKAVMSDEFIKSIEADMKADKKTDFAAYVIEGETIPETPVEVRNEMITGNRAVAEVKGGIYKAWTPFGFVNEGGKWKFTGESPDIEAVDKTANSNK